MFKFLVTEGVICIIVELKVISFVRIMMNKLQIGQSVNAIWVGTVTYKPVPVAARSKA